LKSYFENIIIFCKKFLKTFSETKLSFWNKSEIEW
jgi:hypothetical protein